MSLNKVMLIGNVGADPEVRYVDSNSGSKVATIRIATTERYRDRDGNPREATEWHNVVVWRNLADVVEKYVKKGTQLYVEGRLRTRSWEDQTGNRRFATEVVADNLQLLGRRPEGQGGYGNGGEQRSQSGYQGGYGSGQGGYRQGGEQRGYGSQQGGQYGGGFGQQGTGTQPAAQPAIPSEEDDDDLPF